MKIACIRYAGPWGWDCVSGVRPCLGHSQNLSNLTVHSNGGQKQNRTAVRAQSGGGTLTDRQRVVVPLQLHGPEIFARDGSCISSRAFACLCAHHNNERFCAFDSEVTAISYWSMFYEFVTFLFQLDLFLKCCLVSISYSTAAL